MPRMGFDTLEEARMDRTPDAPTTKLAALKAKRAAWIDLDDGELTSSEARSIARAVAKLDVLIAAEEAAGKVAAE